MIDSYAVILDYITDGINQYWDVTLPCAVFTLVIGLVIFAWRSTEVNTPDEVNGQFTIPGRGTFNVVNTEPSNPNIYQGVRLRNVNQAGEAGQDNESTPSTSRASTTPPPPPVHDQGDPNEEPINIRVRFLDESVQACTFRPSQSLGDFKLRNWTNVEERQRLCLIYGGNPLRDDSIKMSQVGLKEGDTMHGFYKSAPTEQPAGGGQSTSNNNSSQTFQNDLEDDDFDELARYFLPLAGSLLVMTWFYIFSSPVAISMSTMAALLFITGIYTGFAVYNYRHLLL